MDYILTLPKITIKLGEIYRLPNNSVLDLSDLADNMECNINMPGEHVILGDFNPHLNKESYQDTITFKDALESFGLENQIGFQTHYL